MMRKLKVATAKVSTKLANVPQEASTMEISDTLNATELASKPV
jgi:hypothetical protein